MKNNEKGITLVALVITIIVLLILAGVTILALSGDNNGILNRASQSKVSTEIANAKDAFTTVAAEGITEYYNSKYVEGNNTETATLQKTVYDKITASSISSSFVNTASSTSPSTIVTNVNDATGAALTATIDTNGKITWTNDKMTKN